MFRNGSAVWSFQSMLLDGAATCTKNGCFKRHCWPTYIDMSNELCSSWMVTVWEGITWDLTKCILTEVLAWTWLQMNCKWAVRHCVFPAGWATKVPPLNCLPSKSLHDTWHLEKFLALLDGFLYLEHSGGRLQRRTNWWILRAATPESSTGQYGKIYAQ